MSNSQGSMSFQISPPDIVFSCTICQKPLSTIYADDDQNNGLCKDGEGPDDGKVTKLWLTECAHLTCGTHLPGGGAPFHSINEVPRTPCPLCSTENDDHSDKALFFINGTSKGQYDENIPDAYFQTPPIQLSGGDPGLEALRFQYLSLLRLGTKTHEKLMGLAKALGRWEDKKPEIVRSLSSVAPLRDELLSAGQRLNTLGEDISSIENTLKLVGVSLIECLNPQRQVDMHSQYNKTALKPAGQKFSPLDGGSRLAQGSAADLDSLSQGVGIFKGLGGISQQGLMRKDGSSKRKRVDSRSDTEHQTGYALSGVGLEKSGSRDHMPPPPIPMQQSIVYRARIPSSDSHSLKSQRNHVDATHLQRSPITPHRHSSEASLSSSRHAPGSSIQLSNMSLAGARTNSGQSLVDHHRSPRTNPGMPGPVYARGGWQPPPESFDAEHWGCSSSPSSSLLSTGQPLVHRSSIGYHQGSLMFPIEIGDRTIDPRSRSYQSVSSNSSSSYRRRQSILAMQSQLESQAHSRYHISSPNREGRITLPMTPSFASQHSYDRGIGLSNHVRSSSCHTNHQSANSTHRQQLVIATPAHQRSFASPHFSKHQPAYSSSLPSVGRSHTDIVRRNNSFDSGPTPVNGEMRPYSSTQSEGFLLAQDSRAAQIRVRAPLTESQALGPRRRANRS